MCSEGTASASLYVWFCVLLSDKICRCIQKEEERLQACMCGFVSYYLTKRVDVFRKKKSNCKPVCVVLCHTIPQNVWVCSERRRATASLYVWFCVLLSDKTCGCIQKEEERLQACMCGFVSYYLTKRVGVFRKKKSDCKPVCVTLCPTM